MLIEQISDQNKKQRVQNFFQYIEKISRTKQHPISQIIEKCLKTFDFNIKSGPNLMHPLHYAVEANNIKAVEKLKIAAQTENIDFFARDGTHLELAQEYAAPTAPVYKILQKIQAMQ